MRIAIAKIRTANGLREKERVNVTPHEYVHGPRLRQGETLIRYITTTVQVDSSEDLKAAFQELREVQEAPPFSPTEEAEFQKKIA